MDNKIITISREYYAGGRSLAKALSELMGIPWHDCDVVRMTSQASGYSEDEVREEGEEISRLESAIEKMLSGANFYTSSHDKINHVQKDVILDFAKEPCIIVGRGANVILREAGIKTFDIFLYAGMDIRIKRIMEARAVGKDEAKRFLEKHDEFRSIYYNKYFGRSYGDAREYSLSVDTGRINYDYCARMIVDILSNDKNR